MGRGSEDDPTGGGPTLVLVGSSGAAVAEPPPLDVPDDGRVTVDGPLLGFDPLLLEATVPPTAPPTTAPMTRMATTNMMILHFF